MSKSQSGLFRGTGGCIASSTQFNSGTTNVVSKKRTINTSAGNQATVKAVAKSHNYIDIWFGVDKNGVIFACASNGISSMPASICRHKEDHNMLRRYFLDELPDKAVGNLLIPNERRFLPQIFHRLLQKGIFCFSLVEVAGRMCVYQKKAIPNSPLFITELSQGIQSVMREYSLNVDVSLEHYIEISSAF